MVRNLQLLTFVLRAIRGPFSLMVGVASLQTTNTDLLEVRRAEESSRMGANEF